MSELFKPEKQRETVKLLNNSEDKEGDKWYILNMEWYENWKKFTNYDYENNFSSNQAKMPGKINNSSLLVDGKLRKGLLINADVIMVKKAIWDYFLKCYGCDVEEPNIFARKLYFSSTGKLSLDLYPVTLIFINKADRNSKLNGNFCNADTIGLIKSHIRKASNLPPSTEIILYDDYFGEKIDAVDSVTLQESSLDGERTLLYEYQNKELPTCSNGDSSSKIQIPRPTLNSSKNYTHCQKPGLIGLHNLGNTCFMNSAIQCIANVPQLVDYFLSDRMHHDLNEDCRLGSQGVIAKCFAELIQQMWQPVAGQTSISPRNLKIHIGRYAPQFVGYQQHDAHELMMFLFDFLNEDLNRIKDKPYIETKDSDGRPDEEVANESWDVYKRRNDSIIVDLFHGLLKSTVTCPKCNFVSVTFDPFASLSLPLHIVDTEVLLWPQAGKEEHERIRYHLLLPPDYSCKTIINRLRRLRPTSEGFELIVTDLNSNNELRILDPADPQSLKKSASNILVFELPIGPSVQIHMYHEGELILEPFLIGFGANLSDLSRSKVLGLVQKQLHVVSSSLANSFADLISKKLINIDGMNDQLEIKPNLCLSFTFPNASAIIHPASSRRPPLCLYDCLESFTSVETLGANDSWYCRKCKEHQRALKKFDLWRLPSVLIIHLKRFRSAYRMNKINALVDCPLQGLEIFNSKDEKSIYDLVAVSNHMGGLGGGHYTAFCKNRFDNRWYLFDDSYTSPNNGDVVTEAAYVLIYVRRDAIDSVGNSSIGAASPPTIGCRMDVNSSTSSDSDCDRIV